MSVSLTPYTEYAIGELKCSPKVKNQLATCVCRYSTPQTLSQSLVYVIFRVWNAVKAIFGQSDWQVASRNLIKIKDAMKGFHEIKTGLKGEIPGKLLVEKVYTLAKSMCEKMEEIVADSKLERLVETNGKNDPAVLKRINEKTAKCIHSIRNTVEMKIVREAKKAKVDIDVQSLSISFLFGYEL